MYTSDTLLTKKTNKLVLFTKSVPKIISMNRIAIKKIATFTSINCAGV